MSNKKQQIPAIRFNGFTDAWEQRKFEEMLDKNDGVRRGPFGSSLKKEIFVENSDYVVYEQQNAIYDNYKTRYNISKEKFDELHKFSLKENDFIMSGAGTIGRISRVPKGIKPGVFNQALIRFRINSELTSPEYFLQFIRAENMQRKLTGANPGSAITNLVPMTEVKNWDIFVPAKAEQSKLGAFFNQLDNTIALHQRQLNNYKQLKRSLVKKIFSQEIRFKDESGNDYTEWMYKKLVDLCDYMGDGDWIESKDQSSDGVRLIQTGNVGIGIYFDKFDKAKYITQETFEQLKCTEVFEGDILVSRLPDPAGRACIVPKLPYEKLVTAVDCTIIRANSITSNQYLLQCMSTDNYFQKIKKEIAGGTRLRISRKNLEQITFPAPCREEQQKIADFLTIFDTKIEKANQKIELLKDQKKRFMQQMFT